MHCAYPTYMWLTSLGNLMYCCIPHIHVAYISDMYCCIPTHTYTRCARMLGKIRPLLWHRLHITVVNQEG